VGFHRALHEICYTNSNMVETLGTTKKNLFVMIGPDEEERQYVECDVLGEASE